VEDIVKRIAVDIDGVLAQFNTSFKELLHKHLPENAAVDASVFDASGEPKVWSWPSLYAGREATNAAWDFVSQHPSWWGTLPRHSDFDNEAIQELGGLCCDHDVFFITSRRNGHRDTRSWLDFYLYEMPFEVITVPGDKPKVLQHLGLDVLIEDKLEHVLPANEIALRILVNRPYNEHPGKVGGVDVDYLRAKNTLEALRLAAGVEVGV
jgi:uncharacterized HAD superfamily protein